MESVRKQITLPKNVELRYAQLAKENGKNFSEYIGEILTKHLKFIPKKKTNKEHVRKSPQDNWDVLRYRWRCFS